MLKPIGYDELTVNTYESLELGGHICKIMKVEETQSRSGKDMIKIYLDIVEGNQKGYFSKRFKSDTRDNKKWGCIVYQLVQDSKGQANIGLKRFHDLVEKSNNGFSVIWGNNYCDCFKNKLIGGIFGREQYKSSKGTLSFAVKLRRFESVEVVRNGVEIPEDKLLDLSNNTDFEMIPTLPDDDLPF